ncbi:MAG: ABC transporter ATP-binding protein [Pseudomonadota bacterium]
MSGHHEAVPSIVSSYARMFQAAGKFAPNLRLAMRLNVAAAVVEGLAFACFYPLSIALLNQPADIGAAWMWLGAMLVLAALDAALRWFSMKFSFGPQLAEMNYGLRLRLGQQLRVIPLQSMAQRRAGDLGAVLSSSVEDSMAPAGQLSGVIIRIITVPMVAIAATFFVNWKMAVAMIALAVLAAPIYYWRRRGAGRGVHGLAKAHADTEADIVEYIQGLPVLRATSQTGKQAKKLQAAFTDLRDLQKKGSMKGLWPSLAFSSLTEVGLVGLMGLGVFYVLNGELDIASIAALLVIATRFSEPLSLFVNLTVVFDFMEGGLRRIDELLSIKPLPAKKEAVLEGKFDIQFEGVTFEYKTGEEQEKAALRDLNFHLPQGSLTALVGPSGSGKTTITRLMMRYDDPQAGTVKIGDVDIRDLTSDNLMKHISVVFQDVYLFNESILENIRMGNPDASDAEVEDAARRANCHEFVTRLPDGYATNVGDIGGTLSGGERQRISIARAILKDAPIVILDEPTAALDTESEVAVQRAIDALVKDRTVIVIAHRLSTIVGANQILVLEDGQLVEHGNHDALLKQKGRYHAMWTAQQTAKSWH